MRIFAMTAVALCLLCSYSKADDASVFVAKKNLELLFKTYLTASACARENLSITKDDIYKLAVLTQRRTDDTGLPMDVRDATWEAAAAFVNNRHLSAPECVSTKLALEGEFPLQFSEAP